MKFVQVADGQQFEYQGKIYTKKGPLMAVDETGTSKLLPRSAVVKPTSGITATPPESEKDRKIKVAQVIDAFEAFYGQCQTLLEDTETGENDARSVLEKARQEFMDRLAR